MTLRDVQPWSGPVPAASPPDGMSVHQLPTGTYRTRAVFAIAGGSVLDQRHLAATAVLVSHPRGDLLIDAGFGARVEDHVRLLPRFERAPLAIGRTAREQLDAVGYDVSHLIGVVPTHVHWDHVSGLDSLDVPVLMNADEAHYAATDTHGAVFRAVAAEREVRSYEMTDGPYLGFASSWDVHGDGSVVVAHAGGHTPGSVVVFVALPSGERLGFIGDLTWQCDGITHRKQRPWFMRGVTDVDAAVVRDHLDRCIALRDVVHLVPAHDVSAHDRIPRLSAPATDLRR